MTMQKCRNCPAANKAHPCLAQSKRHPRYCELVDPRSPTYQPAYVSLLAKDPCGQPEQAPRLSVANAVGLIARMKACESWEASSECGCGNNRCRLGKGRDGIVSHQDCFACLATAPPSTPAQP
jgi:hypothetical protein